MYSQLKWNSRPSCIACSCMVSLVEIWLHEKWGLAPWPAGFSLNHFTYWQAHGLSQEEAELLFSPSQNHIRRGWRHVQEPELLPAASGSFLGMLLWGWLSGSLSGTHLVSTGGVGFFGYDVRAVFTCRDQPGWQPSWLSRSVFQPPAERWPLGGCSSDHFGWGASLSDVIPVPGMETTRLFHGYHALSAVVHSASKILWTGLFREPAWCTGNERGL